VGLVTKLCDEPLISRLFSVIGRLGLFAVLLEADNDLTLNQLRILFRLYYRHSLTMTEIATALAVSQPTATGIVDRLVDRSLVARDADPADRRRVIVVLAALGRERVEAMRCSGAERASKALDQLTEREQQALFDALEPLHDRLIEPGTPVRRQGGTT
jgi:MarR family transcriptional regulator, temperature-dependent positive regulator of motility